MRRLGFLSIVFVLLLPRSADPGTDCPVVLVVNDDSSASRHIAEHYKYRRLIPEENIVHLSCTQMESIDRTGFTSQIRDPIQTCLETRGLRDSTRYLVLTKGIPLKVTGSGSGTATTAASLCGELALLFRTEPLEGMVANPYYGANEPFDRSRFEIFLVTRLDGFPYDLDRNGTPDDVEGLIDRAFVPGIPNGTYLLDLDPYFDGTAYQMGNDWIRNANTHLAQQGADVWFENTSGFVSTASDLIGYVSWGSHDGLAPDDSRLLNLGFLPGSIATTYESYNAATLNEIRTNGQWLLSDLIHAGLTGAAGYVNEPYLTYVANPGVFLPRYHAGFNLAESFYMSIPYLSWQVTVIGDPLCPSTETFGGPTPTPAPTPTPFPDWMPFEETWEDSLAWTSALKPGATWGSNDPGPDAFHDVNEGVASGGRYSGWWAVRAHQEAGVPQRFVWARRRVWNLVPGNFYRLSFRVATKANNWPNGYLRFGYDCLLDEECTELSDPPGLVAPGDNSGVWTPDVDIDTRCGSAGYGEFVSYATVLQAQAAEIDLWGIARCTEPASAYRWTEMFVDDIRLVVTENQAGLFHLH